MPSDVGPALVLGGTGAVGREVLREFARAGIPATFTYFRSADRARVLESEFGMRGAALDLADEEALREFLRGLAPSPRILVHAAAILSDDLHASWAVNVRSALIAAREPSLTDVVLLGALDRGQSLPIPTVFAATQGALGAMTMALAKERGIRINMIAVGLLGEGLSRGLNPKLLEDYKAYSAYRRLGTAAEVARAVLWLATQNTYMTGRVVPVNGGL